MKIIFIFTFVSFILSCSTKLHKHPEYYKYLTPSITEWKPDDFGDLPTLKEKKLLKKYIPSFWISKESCPPMDFYEQYVPLLSLRETNQKGSRKLLKKYERSSKKWDIKNPPKSECLKKKNPPLYAYAWKEKMELSDGKVIDVTILRYAFVFYKSGLPAKLLFPLNLSSLFSVISLWHYLDIHGGIYYILDKTNRPISMVIGQHNHFRSYIIGVDITQLESQKICYAIRSNEPYICPSDIDIKEHHFPTGPTGDYMSWIVQGRDRPIFGTWDVISKIKFMNKIKPRLIFLTSKDPLITSWNRLGPEIKIFGFFPSFFREAPPGMAIMTIQKWSGISKVAQRFYFDPQKIEILERYSQGKKDFAYKYNTIRFNKAIKNIFK